jgi:predicted dinucleotide-binding enzyme
MPDALLRVGRPPTTPIYPPKVGIIGAGPLGWAIARHISRTNVEVVVANKHGPASLAEVILQLGPLAKAGSIVEAIEPELVIVAVPWASLPDVFGQVGDWEGRIIIDPTNPPLNRDGPQLDLAGRTSSEIVAEMARGAHVVKAFNALPAAVLAQSPLVAQGRRTIFLAGEHERAKLEVVRLITHLGFASIDLGDLPTGGRLLQYPGGALVGDLIRLEGSR